MFYTLHQLSKCSKRRQLPAQIPLSNRYDILFCDNLEERLSEFDEGRLSTFNIKKLNDRLRLGSWNVQELNCTCKQFENSQIMYKNHIDKLCIRITYNYKHAIQQRLPFSSVYSWFRKSRSKD